MSERDDLFYLNLYGEDSINGVKKSIDEKPQISDLPQRKEKYKNPQVIEESIAGFRNDITEYRRTPNFNADKIDVAHEELYVIKDKLSDIKQQLSEQKAACKSQSERDMVNKKEEWVKAIEKEVEQLTNEVKEIKNNQMQDNKLGRDISEVSPEKGKEQYKNSNHIEEQVKSFEEDIKKFKNTYDYSKDMWQEKSNYILIQNSFMSERLKDFDKINIDSRKEIQSKFGPVIGEKLQVIEEREKWVQRMQKRLENMNLEITDIRHNELYPVLSAFGMQSVNRVA